MKSLEAFPPPKPQQPSRPDLSFVPTLCHGSCLWNLRLALFFAVAVAAPIAILVPLHAELAAVVVVCIVAGLAWVYLCVSARKVCWEGGIAKPPAPPPHGPFCNASTTTSTTGSKQRTKINVSRVVLIVNPHGGVKKGREIVQSIENVFASAHVELIVRESEYAGHAIEIARTEPLEGGVSVMAIIGGDGVLS